MNPAEFIKKFKPIVIVIADVNDILSNLEDSDIYSLAELITNGAFMGIHFVIGCDVDSIDSRYDLVSKTIKRNLMLFYLENHQVNGLRCI